LVNLTLVGRGEPLLLGPTVLEQLLVSLLQHNDPLGLFINLFLTGTGALSDVGLMLFDLLLDLLLVKFSIRKEEVRKLEFRGLRVYRGDGGLQLSDSALFLVQSDV
jgi:hypothetical protein